MLRNGAEAPSGTRRAAKWCPIFVRRCTIGVNAKLPAALSFFKLRFSSDAPRIEFAGGERGDNRGTKCPDPKALLDGIQQRFFICARIFIAFNARATADSQWRFAFIAPHSGAYSLSSFVFPFSHTQRRTARSRAHTVRAYPVGVRKRRPLHSAFADRAVGEIGRQSSYKQNAEDGVRLNDKRRTMERGEPRGTGCARAGRHARPGLAAVWSRQRRAAHVAAPGPHGVARVGRRRTRAVRPGIAWRFLGVPSRMSVSRRFPVPDSWSVVAFAPILFPYFALLHPDDIALAHGNGRRASFSGRSARCCRARGAHGFSRENECRHRNAR